MITFPNKLHVYFAFEISFRKIFNSHYPADAPVQVLPLCRLDCLPVGVSSCGGRKLADLLAAKFSLTIGQIVQTAQSSQRAFKLIQLGRQNHQKIIIQITAETEKSIIGFIWVFIRTPDLKIIISFAKKRTIKFSQRPVQRVRTSAFSTSFLWRKRISCEILACFQIETQ